MAIKVTKWQATDGSLHATEGLADQASNLADLQAYVDEHMIYNNGSMPCDGEDLVNWLKQHDRIYIQLLPDNKTQAVDPEVNIPDPDDVVILCNHEWKTAEADLIEASHMYCVKCGVNGDDLYLGKK